MDLQPFTTRARNLPEHADNPVHTDVGGRAAGFDGAIVAGTTIYAYMTHVPAATWGESWLASGGGELRLRRPVLDDDLVESRPEPTDTGVRVVASVDGLERATLDLFEVADAPPERTGEPFAPLEVTMSTERAGYGTRAGDPLSLYESLGIAHPVVWANLANQVFIEYLVTGPWVHTRSIIRHHGLAEVGATIGIESELIERFETRAGERALVDIRFTADGQPVATVEHEALVELR